MNIRQFKILITLSLLSAVNLYGQTDNPKLDKYLMKKMKKSDRIGMQAAYIAHGELIWVGSYGIKTRKETLFFFSIFYAKSQGCRQVFH